MRNVVSKYHKVRMAAASNRSATPEVLLKAMEDPYAEVRRRAAKNPNATPEILLKALADKAFPVRMFAARNPKIRELDLSLEQWIELATSGLFDGTLSGKIMNIPSWVRNSEQYRSAMLLNKLAQ